MQDCFREHPDVYGSELESDAADDEDELTVDAAHAESTPPSRSTSSAESTSKPAFRSEIGLAEKGKMSAEPTSTPQSAEKVTEGRPPLGLVPDNYKPDTTSDSQSQEPVSESESLVPRAAHDTQDGNTEVLGRK
jgi:intermembrane space import and assembly protein 40